MKKLIYNYSIVISCALFIFIPFYYSINSFNKNINILNYKPLIISSASMKPAIQPGDIVVIKHIDTNKIKTGDIITYKVEDSIPITHRVVEIINANDTLMFRAKGDANNSEDKELIHENRIIGIVKFKISYVGYACEFIKSKIGFLITSVMPLVLAFILGFLIIKNELQKE